MEFLESEIKFWHNEINVEKLAGNIVKESFAKGAAHGLKSAVILEKEDSEKTATQQEEIAEAMRQRVLGCLILGLGSYDRVITGANDSAGIENIAEISKDKFNNDYVFNSCVAILYQQILEVVELSVKEYQKSDQLELYYTKPAGQG